MLGGGNEGSKEEDKFMERKVYSRRSFKGLENSNLLGDQQPNDGIRCHNISGFDLASDNFSGLSQDNRVWINLSNKSKNEALELKRKLEGEREVVRSVMRKIELQKNESNVVNNWAVDKMAAQPQIMKKLNLLVHDNSNDNAEKEKRTPKVNKFYRNSEFLLGKDKIPASESNKKLKSNGKKDSKFPNPIVKSCTTLLERLMKHKHAWVFNNPVDAVALGLHDYFEIIKMPMDLSTVKDRLTQNRYNSPTEFAEDVRLTFRNAMTYNLKGQDVYIMAEQLLKIFEDKWALIDGHDADFDVGSPHSTRKAQPQSRPMPKTIDRSESMASSIMPKRKSMNLARSGRIPIPKKPKAKDPNKREMTYEEKQKLSINLQSLPSEKLENVVQIIKKRNPSVSQQDDEIEVDIDSVDTETLWELDRFVTNYKKSLSKNKRKVEIGSGLTATQEQNTKEKITTSAVTENAKGSRKDEERVISPSKPGHNNTNQGASRSGSSSDSGSSSGDSDRESSSANGSNGGPSPKK